ncbi:HepT-like ribonuclease domain-containing protein [Methanospirillum hungatei]|uniref:HepT-like ribonuclease domain-containing protein n=1 Tax=Methanospirillum hungatei TaxID=2203 RepID=UPI00373AEBCD
MLDSYPDIEWRKIAGLRDIIAHSYFNIKPSILWNIIVSKIHPLKNVVESILTEQAEEA